MSTALPLRQVAKSILRAPWVTELRFNVDRRLGRLRGSSRERRVYAIAVWTGTGPLTLHPIPGSTGPALTADMVTDIDAGFVADPFFVRVNGLWWLFCEAWNNHSHKGEVVCASSKDAVSWTYVGRALSEGFHLSYPQVLKHEGEMYLVPESHMDRSVRLYRAEEFPRRWHFERTLLSGEYLDPTIFEAGGLWWLYAAPAAPGGITEELHAFWAESLLGPWRPHSGNPVVSGRDAATRPAGRVVVDGEAILRFGQVCQPVYGSAVRAYRVTTLSPDRYVEEPANRDPVLRGTDTGWNANGMHHLDALAVDDSRWLACVDGWHWNARRHLHSRSEMRQL